MSDQKQFMELFKNCKQNSDSKERTCTFTNQDWETFQSKLNSPQTKTKIRGEFVEDHLFQHKVYEDKGEIHATVRTAILGATMVGCAYVLANPRIRF